LVNNKNGLSYLYDLLTDKPIILIKAPTLLKP